MSDATGADRCLCFLRSDAKHGRGPGRIGPRDTASPNLLGRDGRYMINVNIDSIDRGLVLGNKVLVAEVFAKNGFLVLASVTGEEKTAEVNADQIYQGKGGDGSGHQGMTTESSEIEDACKAEL